MAKKKKTRATSHDSLAPKKIKEKGKDVLYRTILLFPFCDGIEGDKCPMRHSSVEGRAGRCLKLADGLCDKCKWHAGYGIHGSFRCAHPDAESDFWERRLEAMGIATEGEATTYADQPTLF